MEKENQRSWSRTHQNQASFIASRGLEVTLLFSTSGRRRNIFLDIPLYRTRQPQRKAAELVDYAPGSWKRCVPLVFRLRRISGQAATSLCRKRLLPQSCLSLRRQWSRNTFSDFLASPTKN